MCIQKYTALERVCSQTQLCQLSVLMTVTGKLHVSALVGHRQVFYYMCIYIYVCPFICISIKGQIEVTRRRGRRCKKLLDDLKDRRGYCQLKEEALDRTMWRNHFGRGFGPVV